MSGAPAGEPGGSSEAIDLIPDARVDALLVATAPGWGAVALRDLPAVLSDHAHAEKKAALSALSLLNREPGRTHLVARMAKLAREELRHLDQVLGHLRERGWPLQADRGDRYARRLAALRRTGHVDDDLVDRLLVAALIEARSWERLKLLGAALERTGEELSLAAFYADLARSEGGHYRLFVDLARSECPRVDVDGRLAELAVEEAALIRSLPHEPRIH